MSGLVTQPKHLDPSWDMHTPGNVVPVQIQPGEVVRGEVVCHHPFGLGLYLPDHDTYGHVNIPNVADTVVHGPDEFPPIGSKVWARSFGIRGDGRQLNLAMRGVTAPE
jgi:predicted RNA-binding protein with RPS1 domain